MAGDNAAAVAWGMGAHVTVFDLNINILRKIDAEYGGAIETRYSARLDLETAVKEADLVIGAVLVRVPRPQAGHQRDCVADEAGCGSGGYRHRPGRLL